ncbi:MAG: permease [Bacillota bacterium]
MGLVTLIYPRLTGKPLFPVYIVNNLKALPFWQIPIFYVISYISRAWGPLLFAFLLGGFIIAFIPQDRLQKLLNTKKIKSYFLAASVAPLLTVCSCAMLPLFGALLVSGVGIGPAVTFLLMAPAANIMAIIFTGELISWKLAIMRLVFSYFGSIIIGFIISMTSFGKAKELEFINIQQHYLNDQKKTFLDNSYQALEESWGLAKKVLPILLIGVAAISFIEAYLPPQLVAKYLTGFRGIVLGSVIGVPTYTPTLVEVFLIKAMLNLGMSPAAALAFMIGGPMCSIPSMLGASRLAGWKVVGTYALLAVFVGIFAGCFYQYFIVTL